MRKEVVAIVQARMGSSRLPGKILMSLQGMPVIWHICSRLKLSKEVDKVVVATSSECQDDILVEFLFQNKIEFFRGSENDVLDRFYRTAKVNNAHYIVRVTADCPLIDPNLVSDAITTVKQDTSIDYAGLACGAGVFNERINKYPDGLDTEVFTFNALERAWKEATSDLDRGEAVTSYLWRDKSQFNVKTIPANKNYGNHRWTLDTPEDFEFIKYIYDKLYHSKKDFGMHDVLNLIEQNP